MSTTQGLLPRFLADHDGVRSLELTARMFGLSQETVTTIVQVGVPMMARLAETNLELRRRMDAASLAMLPESLHDFYTHMLESTALRQATMDDYKATYGTILDAVNRTAAKEAGTTDGQARDVLAAVLPAFFHVLRKANASGSDQAVRERITVLLPWGYASPTSARIAPVKVAKERSELVTDLSQQANEEEQP